nr:zinc finger, CCHC-type [Tanacetum cinerariifolium]
MDTKSEPFEDPVKIEAPELSHTIASPTSLPDSTPPTLVPILCKTVRMVVCVPPTMLPGLSASMAEVAAMSDSTFRKRFRSFYKSSPSSSPPDLPLRKRYRGTSELVEDDEEGDDKEEDEEIEESLDYDSESEDAEDEFPTAEDEDPVARDEGFAARDEGPSTGKPLGLGYRKLRRQEKALGEGRMPSVFEVGQSSGFVPESERPKRVLALRQTTLTTWIYLEDAPSIFPSPISSPMIPLIVPSPAASPATAEAEGFLTELGAQVEMQGGLIRDHTVRLRELSPALFERCDMDIGELFTRSGAVRDEIFSQRYRFRSLEHEQERTAVTFGALWRLVLAFEARVGHVDTRMIDMSWAGYDDHRLVHDMLLQQAALQRELHEMRDRFTAVEQEKDRKERDAIFNENRFSSIPRPSQRSLINETKDIVGSAIFEEATEEDNPKAFDEAMKSQDVAFWKEAINDEMDSIMSNNTWVLTNLPSCFKPLGFKWIFKRKLKLDKTIEKFKARLVVQGFRQKSRINYFDTYAPVAHISTIRLLITMTSIHNLIIHQMDVKTSFLNGELDEEVYMNQPRGFIMPGNENKVNMTKEFLSCKFSMKDMGEADVILGIRINHEIMGRCGFARCLIEIDTADVLEESLTMGVPLIEDSGFYIETVSIEYEWKPPRCELCKIFGHVHDQCPKNITVTPPTAEKANDGFQTYEPKAATNVPTIRASNMGNAYKSGSSQGGNITVSNSYAALDDESEEEVKNVNDESANLFNSTKIGGSSSTFTSTLIDTSEKLMPNNGQAVSQLEYFRVIGCLMYAMTCTRPDIAFAVGKLSRYSNPGTQHWQEIQRALNGRVVLLGGGEISWPSKKQTCIIGSIMESEFVALVVAGKEVEWLRNPILDILLWRNMIHELITNGVVSVEFVRSQRNLSDHLTMGLARDLVLKSVGRMGLKSNQVAELLRSEGSNNLLWKVITRLQVISGNHLCNRICSLPLVAVSILGICCGSVIVACYLIRKFFAADDSAPNDAQNEDDHSEDDHYEDALNTLNDVALNDAPLNDAPF